MSIKNSKPSKYKKKDKSKDKEPLYTVDILKDIKIDKDIPLQKDNNRFLSRKEDKNIAMRELLAKMEIGDSFFLKSSIPVDGGATSIIRSEADKLGIKLSIRTRRENDVFGVRIFRVENKEKK